MASILAPFFKRFPKAKLAASRLYAGVPARLRIRKSFFDWLAFYETSEAWSKEQHDEWKLERIRALLTGLKTDSPFYREVLSGVNPSSIQDYDDFTSRVPVLERSVYREQFSRILSEKFNRRESVAGSTSGTTGLALQFYHTKDDMAREWASICHQWRRVGYDPLRSVRAEFRGLTIEHGGVDVFPHENMIRVDILNMNESTVRRYAGAMTRHGVEFYHGYPSALSTLADIVTAHGIRFPSPKAFLLASEMLYDWQLEKIRRAFPDARVYAHYGCAERTVLGGWCEKREEYHLIPSYAFVEFDGATGEIIGTNLHNTVNGFVRYRMTDTASMIHRDACPDCGRAYTPRIDGIDGRAEDYLFSPERGWVPPALITYPFKGLTAISNTQLHQTERDRIRIDFMTHPGGAPDQVARDQAVLRGGFVKILGESVRIDFARVEDIPRTASGKYKWVVCTLDKEDTR